MRILLIAAAVALTPFAASASGAPPVVQPASVQQGQPLVCHYYYYEGMVLRRPDCRTASEWNHRRIDEQRFVREFQLRALVGAD